MSDLEIKREGNIISITGIIDEHSDFSNIFDRIEGTCIVNMEGISRVNSCGVREWAHAVAETNLKIKYINCPPAIVEQFNMVPEFLGENTDVISFYARYYCEDCDIEELFLIETNRLLLNADRLTAPEFVCECGAIFEFDDEEDEYFMFLEEY